MERVLGESRNSKIRVFVVWEPILPTDWRSPTTSTLARISDPRVAQYWDPHHVASEEIKRSLAAIGLPLDGHTSGGDLWDFALLYPPEPPTQNALPTPVFADGPVADVITRLSARMQDLANHTAAAN